MKTYCQLLIVVVIIVLNISGQPAEDEESDTGSGYQEYESNEYYDEQHATGSGYQKDERNEYYDEQHATGSGYQEYESNEHYDEQHATGSRYQEYESNEYYDEQHATGSGYQENESDEYYDEQHATGSGYQEYESNEYYDEQDSLRNLVKETVAPGEGKAPYFSENEEKLMQTVKVQSRFEDSTIKLNCRASGRPTPHIRWFFELNNCSDPNRPIKNRWFEMHFGYPLRRYYQNYFYIKSAQVCDSGYYKCRATNEFGNMSFTYKIEIFKSFPAMLTNQDQIYTNVSVIMGEQTALVTSVDDIFKIEKRYWYKLPENNTAPITIEKILSSELLKEFKPPEHILYMDNVNLSHQGWYACMVEGTIFGESHQDEFCCSFQISLHYLTVTQEPTVQPFYAYGIVSAIAVFICLSLYIYYRRKVKKISNTYWGKKILVYGPESSENYLPAVKIQKYKKEHDMNKQDKTKEIPKYELPLDSNWEIPRENINLSKQLGEGAFGYVVKAKFKHNSQGTQIVAVKMLKENHDDDEMVDLVTEMELMKMIGKHPNVLELIGCCTQGGPLYVVVEYAPHGNLLNFLRRHKLDQQNHFLNENQLIHFCHQIALGMEYISSKKYIHRDLAARNVLVTDKYVLKIGDFGLSRECMNYYQKKTAGLLPIKWMSPEALSRMVFSTKSDVWSYGILMYEIMTLGEVPYPSVPSVVELYTLLKNGYRMERPSDCPEEIYKIMQECWNFEGRIRRNVRHFLKL